MKLKLYGILNQLRTTKVDKEKSNKLVGTLPKCNYLQLAHSLSILKFNTT